MGQFWAKLAVGNANMQKSSANTGLTEGSTIYSMAGATYRVFVDKGCTDRFATLATDKNGNTETVEVKTGTVYIKDLSSPAGFTLDKNVYPLTVKAGKTATLKVSDTPKATTTLIELFKIDMGTSKSVPQGNASLEGAEFTWNFYAGYYNKDNLPKQPTRTWITKTVAIKEVPGEPSKPEQPKTPSSHKPADSPKTGNNTNVAGFALMLGLSAAGLAFAAYKKRHTMKHDTDK